MESNKNCSLFVEGIEGAIQAFVNTIEGKEKVEMDKSNSSRIICKIGSTPNKGVITFYVKKNGLVSISVQGAESMEALCVRCRDFVIQRTAIPNSLRKNFTIREINMSNIDYFKEDLKSSYKISIEDNGQGTDIAERSIVKDEKGVVAYYTIYSNGTFLLQGNVTPLYVCIMTAALRWFVEGKEMDSIDELIVLSNTTQTIDDEIDKLVPNLSVCQDTDGVLNRMIMTSVVLFNSGIIVEDYGCYTFGVLKALEGIMKLRLSDDFGVVDKLGEYFDFDNTTHRHNFNKTLYDGEPRLKMALNKSYNQWVASRHSTFHADTQIVTSTLLTYELALEIFYKAIECINDLCNNW